MDGKNKKTPKFWINPNTRLHFPQFSLQWQQCDIGDLLAFCEMEHPRCMTYVAGTTCVHLVHSEDYSTLYVLYHKDQRFENLRLQKWLRESIRDIITIRASNSCMFFLPSYKGSSLRFLDRGCVTFFKASHNRIACSGAASRLNPELTCDHPLTKAIIMGFRLVSVNVLNSYDRISLSISMTRSS